jgi:hypothetical protein
VGFESTLTAFQKAMKVTDNLLFLNGSRFFFFFFLITPSVAGLKTFYSEAQLSFLVTLRGLVFGRAHYSHFSFFDFASFSFLGVAVSCVFHFPVLQRGIVSMRYFGSLPLNILFTQSLFCLKNNITQQQSHFSGWLTVGLSKIQL